MAQGFANCYGNDVMQAESAGLSPAAIIQPLTYEVMREKNVSLEGQFTKDLASVGVSNFQMLVNMSGVKLPSRIPLEVREWKVEDPIGREAEVYRQVRDQIEHLVMRLILELRRETKSKAKVTGRRVLAKLAGRRR
jgi:arsenate reductase